MHIFSHFANEMFKNLNNMFPEITNNLFCTNHYNLRRVNNVNIRHIGTVYHGSERFSYLGPKVWDIVPERFKTAKSLNNFKESTKKWKTLNCPCRLCKTYVSGVGFI